MKNINLVSPSSTSVKEVRGNKPLILVGLILLMVLCAVYFSQTTPFGKRWFSLLMERVGSKIDSYVVAPRPKKGSSSVKTLAKKAADAKKSVEGPPGTSPEENEQVGKGTDQEMPDQRVIHKDVQGKGDVPPQVIQNAPPTEHKVVPAPASKPAKDKQKGISGSPKVAQKDAPAEIRKPKEIQAKQKAELKEKPKEEVSKTLPREGSASSSSRYYLQLCSCVIKENAEGLLKKMISMGYAPVIKENPGKVRMYNVYSGTFTQKSEAVKVLNRLKGDGFDPVLIPSSEGRFTLRIASCILKESAKKIGEKLNRQGYQTGIREEMTQTAMYSVVLENFGSAKEAEAVRQDLMKKGFESPILKSSPQSS